MRRTPDSSEILIGFGLIALLAICPPVGVIVVICIALSK